MHRRMQACCTITARIARRRYLLVSILVIAVVMVVGRQREHHRAERLREYLETESVGVIVSGEVALAVDVAANSETDMLKACPNLYAISGSPSFKYAAVVSKPAANGTSLLSIIDTDRGQIIGSYEQVGQINRPCWSQNERHVAATVGGSSAGSDRQGVLILSLPADISSPITGRLRPVAPAPDDDSLAVLGSDEFVFQCRLTLRHAKPGQEYADSLTGGFFPQAISAGRVAFQDRRSIWILGLATGRRDEIFRSSGMYDGYVISPCGEVLVYTHAGGVLSGPVGRAVRIGYPGELELMPLPLHSGANCSVGMTRERVLHVLETLRGWPPQVRGIPDYGQRG